MKKIIQDILRKIGYELMRVQEVPNKPIKFDSGKYEIDYRHVFIDSKEYFLPSFALDRPVIAIEDNENSCKNFLLDINYNFVRKIPGLKIYVPNEDSSIVEVLTSF